MDIIVLIDGSSSTGSSRIELVTARKTRLQKDAEAGDGAGLATITLGTDPARFLSTAQVGIASIRCCGFAALGGNHTRQLRK